MFHGYILGFLVHLRQAAPDIRPEKQKILRAAGMPYAVLNFSGCCILKILHRHAIYPSTRTYTVRTFEIIIVDVMDSTHVPILFRPNTQKFLQRKTFQYTTYFFTKLFFISFILQIR